MKKTSIEMLLLLTSAYNKKQVYDLNKDLGKLSAEALEALLGLLDEQKRTTFSTVADSIGAAVEKRQETSGTSDEISYLLLTRYKLKVPVAAQRLSEQLSRFGYETSLTGPTTKANFTKWLRQVCEQVPREKVMESALSLRPQSG